MKDPIIKKFVEDAIAITNRSNEDIFKRLATQLWQEAFSRGYERGKSDERDAKSIDESLNVNEDYLGDGMSCNGGI